MHYYPNTLIGYTLAITTGLMLAIGSSAQAQHSDIEFEFHEGHIDILGSHEHEEGEEEGAHEEEEHHDHGEVLLFEGSFEVAFGEITTANPGFGAEANALTEDTAIGYNAVGPLVYHNGTAFSSTSATLTIDSPFGNDVAITSATSSGSGFIGTADTDGSFHAHVNYGLSSSAANGAYIIELTLSAYDENFELNPAIEDSSTFYIAFNHGLDEMVFEDAVAAFVATVPEPTSALLLAGLGGLAMIRRRTA